MASTATELSTSFVHYEPRLVDPVRCRVAAQWLASRRLIRSGLHLNSVTRLTGRFEDEIIRHARLDAVLAKTRHTPLSGLILALVDHMDVRGASEMRLAALHYVPYGASLIHLDHPLIRNNSQDGFLTIAGSGVVNGYRTLDPAAPYRHSYEPEEVEIVTEQLVRPGDFTEVTHTWGSIHEAKAFKWGRSVLNLIAEP